MRSCLQVLAPSRNVFGNLEILLRKGLHVVTKLGGFTTALDLDFTSQCLELINVSRPDLIFNGKQLKIELLLIGLLQEGH